MVRVAFCFVGSLLIAASTTAAGPAQQAFAKLKGLEGTWVGKAEGMNAKVVYKLTGGGSALVETLFPGTPHEMVTIYFLDDDRLLLTHYCSAHNQPTMQFVPSRDPARLSFDFVSGTNMKPTDAHMHTMSMRLLSPDRIQSIWESYKDGKPVGKVSLDLHRQKRVGG